MSLSGLSACLTSVSMLVRTFGPQNADSGSTMTTLASILIMACSMAGMSSGMVTTRSLPPCLTWNRCRSFLGSPPAFSHRGRTVSARSSSADISTTPTLASPSVPNVLSGILAPTLARALRSRASRLLPRPGSPSIMLSFPKARRGFHNHWYGLDSTSSIRVPISMLSSVGTNAGCSSTICRYFSLVPPSASQSLKSPPSPTPGNGGIILVTLVVPCSRSATSKACSLPGPSLSWFTITVPPLKNGTSRSLNLRAPPKLVVAIRPSSLAASASVSPSKIWTGSPFLMASRTSERRYGTSRTQSSGFFSHHWPSSLYACTDLSLFLPKRTAAYLAAPLRSRYQKILSFSGSRLAGLRSLLVDPRLTTLPLGLSPCALPHLHWPPR